MQVREGDTIGTKDGRYGIVTFLVTQKKFLVKEHPDVLDPGTDPAEFWTDIDNVASIV